MANAKVAVSQLVLCALLAVTGTYGKPPNAIVGGEVAADNEFPYQVSLRMYGQHVCGGSIIDSTHVLTAAHCVEEGNQLVNRLAVVTSTNNLRYGGRPYEIKRITKHPQYVSAAEVAWKNDLAILTLKSPMVLDSRAQPIRLPTRNVAAGSSAVASGWGFLDTDGPTPDNLRKLNMRLIASRQCSIPGAGPITENHLCAFVNVGSGVCSGDSGGPLVSNGELVGVASFVIPCGKGYPDIFSRVYNYVDWIKLVVQSS